MESEQHASQFIAVAVQVGRWHYQHLSQANRHWIVGRVYTDLVSVDSGRGNELIQARRDAKLLLTEAASEPRFL